MDFPIHKPDRGLSLRQNTKLAAPKKPGKFSAKGDASRPDRRALSCAALFAAGELFEAATLRAGEAGVFAVFVIDFVVVAVSGRGDGRFRDRDGRFVRGGGR